MLSEVTGTSSECPEHVVEQPKPGEGTNCGNSFRSAAFDLLYNLYLLPWLSEQICSYTGAVKAL
jgi:hypothetical protein